MLRNFALFWIWITGWKTMGAPIPVPKLVLVVAYHTSNWDGFTSLKFNIALNAKVSWVGKASIFWWPLGAFLRSVGGIPIHRESSGEFVNQMVEQFNTREYFVLGMAPEGTRKRAHYWRTGFYYIALNAKVPIQVAALDYGHKSFIFSPLVHPTGDIKKDMAQIREFLRPCQPKNPLLADLDFEVE